MRMTDRFTQVDFKQISDGLGGQLPEKVSESTPKSCNIIQVSKEWISKEFNIEIEQPLELFTSEELAEDTYIKYLDTIYQIRKKITPRYKRIKLYLLEEVDINV